MLSIKTNYSGIIAEKSMRESTRLLNEAIERMSTGLKINRAKDDAAGYAIVTDMSTKISAYEVAEENTAMGLDMLTTAADTLNLITGHLQRLRDLAEQAGNDTYGESALRAINAEANTRVNEIQRLYSTAEYNGILLFDNSTNASKRLQAGEDGFIKPVEQKSTAGLDKLSGVSATADLPDGTYSISTPQELAKLAQMTNDGYISEGDIFILADDIDLAQWCADNEAAGGWVPIGNNTNKFLGTFDGNGYNISNLFINRSGENFQALFGRTDENSVIKNVGVINVDITSDAMCTGAVVGAVAANKNTLIDNCYSSGKIRGGGYEGGIVGQGGNTTNCYSTCSVSSTGDYYTGGLVGYLTANVNVKNCFTTGDVSGSSYNIGGLIGGATKGGNTVENCYSTGNVSSTKTDYAYAGGLIGGSLGDINVLNSHATGNIESLGKYSGGLIGSSSEGDIMIESCYATGNLSGTMCVGGLVGMYQEGNLIVENCYATGSVCGNDSNIGGFIGAVNGEVSLSDSYCIGDVNGLNTGSNVGGFLGYSANNSVASIENCYTRSAVLGVENNDGAGFIGYMGESSNVTMKNCSVLGDISKSKTAVFLARNNGADKGTLTMENCQYNSELNKTTLPLVCDINGVDITDDTIRAAVSECGFETPFNLENKRDNNIALQVGIDSSENSTINLSTTFSLDYLEMARQIGNGNKYLYSAIDQMLEKLSIKQIELGSTQNRLESALDEIMTNYDNLVSSRSTLRDADIAEESSKYIQYQILQQAASTLIATANQLPAIALSLI